MVAKRNAGTPGSSGGARATASDGPWHKLLAIGAGGCLAIALLKFGNPVIFDTFIEPPANIWEFLFQAWPVAWGYWLVATIALLGLKVRKLRTSAPRWLVWLPLIWLAWQFVAGTQSVEPKLTRATLIHFSACVCWFYLGLMALPQVRALGLFWGCLLVGFVIVLWAGFEQHYGGLEATRQFIYEQTDWQKLSPDYLRKIASNRIFATLVYPNALAAAILLLLPVSLVAASRLSASLPGVMQKVVVGVLAYGGLACLYWSGSKAGWLVALAVVGVAGLQMPIARRAKAALIIGFLALGIAAFAVRYAGYFERGASSAAARLDYWEAAAVTAARNPVFGTGPGTFAVPYKQLKRPDSEMARLVHNDYLEQASDSGIPGFVLYLAFVWGGLWTVYFRKRVASDWTAAVRLGVLGWALHSTVEFLLYIPALAWPAVAFLGWLVSDTAPENESTANGPMG